MESYKRQMQKIVSDYEEATGRNRYTASEVARWAIENNLWDAPATLLIRRCADDLAKALREEYTTDPQGRRSRTKHVALVEKDGEQIPIWADMRRAPRNHMMSAFQLRRRQIVSDCKQLKTDVDSYNDNYNLGEPIQLVFDFSNDLVEAQLAEEIT